jgi:hypothetical protein
MPPSKALKALEAEATAEPGDHVSVPLKGKTVRVKNVLDWETAALDDLQNGKLEPWARGALVDGDYTAVWSVVRPTVREANAFLEAWGKTSGENPGD